MLNRVVLVGRLTRDVELRYTSSGVAVGSFTIAVNRSFTNQAGEREADFVSAVIWRKAAENFANFTGKGAQVAIEGRLQTRNYENNQGQKVYVTEVVVDNFDLLESKADSDARRASQGQSLDQIPDMPTAANDNQTSSLPSIDEGNADNSSDPFAANNNGSIDISDDDLPF